MRRLVAVLFVTALGLGAAAPAMADPAPIGAPPGHCKNLPPGLAKRCVPPGQV